MLRILAVDDELPALDELTHLLRDDPRIAEVAGASDPAAALRGISRMLAAGERLDAVFLDIRMPGLDGLDLSRLLSGFADPPCVVFVTAHDDCAVTAFDLGAVDYLLKPVRPERLAEAVRRVTGAARPEPAAPDRRVEPSPEDEVIPVEVAGRTRLLLRRSVTHAEASGDYVRLHTGDETYLVRMSLAGLERRWQHAGFVRIHRSTLVACAHVLEMRLGDGRATVRVGGRVLAVSRRHIRLVRDRLLRGAEHGHAVLVTGDLDAVDQPQDVT